MKSTMHPYHEHMLPLRLYQDLASCSKRDQGAPRHRDWDLDSVRDGEAMIAAVAWVGCMCIYPHIGLPWPSCSALSMPLPCALCASRTASHGAEMDEGVLNFDSAQECSRGRLISTTAGLFLDPAAVWENISCDNPRKRRRMQLTRSHHGKNQKGNHGLS